MRIISILLALGFVVGGAVAPAASVEIDDGSISIAASPAFSGVLQPGQPMLISGTVTNSSGQDKDGGVASVYIGRSRLTTQAALSTWLSSDGSADALSDVAVASQSMGVLASGHVRSFSLTIPASAIPLSPGQAGVYPVSVSLTAGTVQLDLARSTVVWASDALQHSLNLSIVAPLVPPLASAGILSVEDLEALTAPGGAFDTQLTIARTHSLTLGVDPRIIASIRLLGTNAPPAVLAWLTRLETLPTDLFPLAYADADLTLQREAGAKAPLVPTAFPLDRSLFPKEPENIPAPSGSAAPAGESPPPTPESLVSLSGAMTGIAWPSETMVNADDLDFFEAGGYSRTLATSATITRPTGLSPNVTVGEHRLTVSDATVSALLRDAALAQSLAEWSQAMTALTGALSISATEHPDATLVATMGHEGSATGASLDKTLTALSAQSWVTPISFRDALLVPAFPAKLVEDEKESDRATKVGALFASEQATERFATVVDVPSLVTGPQRLDLLALLSSSWEDQPSEWVIASEAFLATNSELRASVHLPASSPVTLLQEKSNLPIAVRNELDFPVTVYVTVRPERGILSVLDSQVELNIEANSQAKVFIPVQSIANGEVRTMVTLSSASNKPISTPTFLVLIVRAGWETAATVMLAILIVAMFIGGIWRTVLRRRKAAARQTQDDETSS